jgi:hypothetical protein
MGELNAALNHYNVAADIGSEGSRIRKNNGILYRVLDKEGNRVGVPIKASDFHFKPTHRKLKVRFLYNEMNPNRTKDSLRVKNSIDFTLYGKQNVSLPRLINILQKDGIDTVIRKNEEGKLYGITYLDHRTRSVFKPLTRKIALRMGIVFGHADGAFPRLLNLVKFGLGGKQGDGGQYMSWIHEQDAAKCTEWLLQHETMNGIINCTSPEPVKNDIFMANLRHIYGIPVGLPAPCLKRTSSGSSAILVMVIMDMETVRGVNRQPIALIPIEMDSRCQWV